MPQVNINLDNETAQALDEMTKDDGFDNRSAFVRRLIRLEVRRRKASADDDAGPHAPLAINPYACETD